MEEYAEEIKGILVKIFQRARAEDPQGMAPYMLYRGNDKNRNWQVFAEMIVEEDRKHVERMARRIKRYMDESEGYSFQDFFTEEDRDGNFWYVWEVHFRQGPDKKICDFKFKQIDGAFGLGNIDT